MENQEHRFRPMKPDRENTNIGRKLTLSFVLLIMFFGHAYTCVHSHHSHLQQEHFATLDIYPLSPACPDSNTLPDCQDWRRNLNDTEQAHDNHYHENEDDGHHHHHLFTQYISSHWAQSNSRRALQSIEFSTLYICTNFAENNPSASAKFVFRENVFSEPLPIGSIDSRGPPSFIC